MFRKKYFWMPALIVVAILIVSSALKPGKFKNLKVLPQDISQEHLDSMMFAYCKALNVGCDFCHVKLPPKNGSQEEELDFAADMQMKENARDMIRMMMDINQKYFHYDKKVEPVYLNAISCNTCHRGNPFPLKE